MPSSAILNFSGGPGALPDSVLREASEAIVALPETGVSVLGMSHRSDWFQTLVEEAERTLRALLGLDDRYAICFLQGGSSLLFATVPMNFAGAGRGLPAYVDSGYWSAKASAEANRVGGCRVVWDGRADGYRRLPALASLALPPDTAYLHYVSNETVEGLQFAEPDGPAGAPLIADMSSDFLSKPVDVGRHAMIYAHAQKNLGPAGVTVAIIDRDWLARIPDGLPSILDFRTHVTHRSNYNTPPVFAIYVLARVARWLAQEVGGLGEMARRNEAKARRLYATLDGLGDAIKVHADARWRSSMNAAFTFGDARLDQAFVEHARERGMIGLEGHRSLGGLRASLYNAVTPDAVASLCEALTDFSRARV